MNNTKNIYAIEVQETLTRQVFVKAESLKEALNLVERAYDKEIIILDADNSNVDVNYVEMEFDEETECTTEYLKCNSNGQLVWVNE